MTYSAHVQHPKGSGYMLGGGRFSGSRKKAIQQAVEEYIRLCCKDSNSYGQIALERNPEPIQVLLIPRHLQGPDMMAYTGFCNVWDENGNDAFDVEQPKYSQVPNPLYKGGIKCV